MSAAIRIINITLLSAFFLSGCYINHNLSKYPSQEKFYHEVNKLSEDREVKIKTKSDSVITAENGVAAANDTVTIIHKRLTESPVTIPLNLISSIHYTNYDAENLSAKIQLAEGTVYEAEKITTLPDSLKFFYTESTRTSVPASEIKRVSYTKHWLGIPGGTLLGLFGGALIGTLIPYYEGPHGDTSFSYHGGMTRSFGLPTLLGAFAGCIVGAVSGYIFGFDYNYNFDR